MKILLEELDRSIFRQVEDGSDPLPMSNVFMKDEDEARRTSKIDSFFREKEKGFTYKKFKDLIRPSIDGLFGTLKDGPKKSAHFAKMVEARDEKGDVKIEYDEYIETFFMYFYYQLFVKLFSDQEKIVRKNEDSINNAKDLMLSIPESLVPDVEENLLKLYRSFYSIFSSLTTNYSKIGTDIGLQRTYFENFANQNVSMFKEYPISEAFKGAGPMEMKMIIDSLFDALNGVDFEGTTNRQITSVRLLSEFVRGSSIDFDVVKFQDMTKQQPLLLGGQSPIKFPSKVESLISDVITELSSIDDIDDVGMSWAKNTKWEPYIKLICGIVCLEKISSSVGSAASSLKKQKSKFTFKLDVSEQDGGVYFINNMAFVAAAKKVPGYESLVKDLDTAMDQLAQKTKYFQDLSGKPLIRAMFVQYDAKGAAIDIDKLGSSRNSIEKIMKMTNLITKLGPNFDDAVAQINLMIFNPDREIPKTDSPVIDRSIEYAMKDVGDFILNPIETDLMDAFKPGQVWQGIKEIGSTAFGAFSKLFNGAFSSSDATDPKIFIDAFNKTFGDVFNFARMQTSQKGGYVVVMGDDNSVAHELKTVDDMKKYVLTMCTSMGSIMYHSKVLFGEEGSGEDDRYKRYFNVLSWFIRSLKEEGKGSAVGTDQYQFLYLVTPFFLDVVKYSFRTFVNNIEDVLDISEDLRDKVKASHSEDVRRNGMDDEQWMPIVEQLTQAIEAHLSNKKY